MRTASVGGSVAARDALRPVRARWWASKVASSPACSTDETPSPF
jgi:hypothetical protein